MANHSMIENIAKRLNVDDAYCIKKCQEFLRILQAKNTLKMSEQVQIIICLDLATSITGSAFDKETALQLCSFKKSVYENNFHNIQKILDLDKPISINELCVKFSCTHLKGEAEKLYSCYKQKDPKIKDDEHPQYAAAAVYTVCKLNNLKPSKSEFSSISRLRPNQWGAIVNEFEKFAASMGVELKKLPSKKKNYVEEILVNKESSPSKKMKEEQKKPNIEEYEVWKKRILQIAKESLRNESEKV
ncbi:origin recognition complex subunit 6 [Coccinella septempunctata]|uniref:origin recognition complex subunit 6 n=1 Tax=Coccinella septempunctata TaxID=41139 RepID=UPI001D060BDA|nr:origin recognition complex subunit 6 [Coccinella septempunctata]